MMKAVAKMEQWFMTKLHLRFIHQPPSLDRHTEKRQASQNASHWLKCIKVLQEYRASFKELGSM